MTIELLATNMALLLAGFVVAGMALVTIDRLLAKRSAA